MRVSRPDVRDRIRVIIGGYRGLADTSPCLVTTADERSASQFAAMFLKVKGPRRKIGDTATMIFKFKHLIAFASRFTTLLPGDLLITGARRGAERVSHAVR